MANSTKVCTRLVRFSYVSVFEPRKVEGSEEAEYSVTLLIPKSDTITIQAIKAAMAEAREAFCKKNGSSSLPAKPVHTLHDGDGLKDSGEPYGEECKGCWVISVRSKKPVKIIDQNKQPITDPEVLYSGCYGQAVINFYGYNRNGRKGISASLMGLRKIKDGERLSGSVCSDDDFDDASVADDLGSDEGWM